jgi:hypothetical protein
MANVAGWGPLGSIAAGRNDNRGMVTRPTPDLAVPAAARWWRRPHSLALAIAVGLLVAAFGWMVWRGAPQGGPATGPQRLPWQVRVQADGGSEVFGLTIGRTTAAEVTRRFSQDLRLALVASAQQPTALEAYVESFQAGFITGKLVLAFDADPRWLAGALERSPRHELAGDGTARRHALAGDDLAQAQGLRLAALAFLPAARLDEATIVARFGAPAERVAGRDGEVHLLYPALGLAATVPPPQGELARARAVLQYVAPRDFERRLRAPLAAASAAAAAR